MKIASVHARQILDSRGFPTVEAEVTLDNGSIGRAAVPSGASTGSAEALELRDNGTEYGGKSVHTAVKNVNEVISTALKGRQPEEQTTVDELLCNLDGTENKSKLGANAILAVSLAVAHASALAMQKPLYEHIGALSGITDFTLPMPLMNVINGGQHADGSTDIQEFMIIPKSGVTFADRLRIGAEVFQALKKLLSDSNYATTVGDEGGFAPHFTEGNQQALEVLSKAVSQTPYKLGSDIAFALDVAASELQEDGMYHLRTEGKTLSGSELIAWYQKLCESYPITSIEDGLGEKDWAGWEQLTSTLGNKIQLVGDDLFVTNTTLLKQGIERQAGNAILIKPNQIGTLTETINAVQMAKQAGFGTIISHRSGETEDTTIAHLAVGLNAGQIKTGSLSRSERLAKYNELLRIEEHLQKA